MTTPNQIEWPKLIEEALTVEGSLGNVYNRFYSYSFLNQLLLRMQGVHEPVATYKRWQGLGRQVVKGSVAKEIIRPITVKRTDEDGEVDGTFTRFKLVRCLFGVSDTVGEDLPPAPIPSYYLDSALDTLDIRRVRFEMLDGDVQGYARGHELAINPVAVYPLKTTFHEMSHIVSGHTTPDQLAEYRAHRGVREFEAEGAAFLSMNELGMLDDVQASESRAYLQHWMAGETPPDASIRRVFSSTDKILRAGRVAVEAA